MTELKAHAPAEADLVADHSERGEGGAGIVVVVLACLLVLGLLAGGGVIGFVAYVGSVRQLQEERQRLLVMAEMERAQAELAAQNAEAAARQAERAEALAAAQAKLAELATPPDSAQVTEPQPTPEERFEAEMEPLNQAVLDRPDDPQVWIDRGRAYQRWRKWKEAAEDFENFLESDPGRVWVRLEAAVTRLANGDRDAYMAHCKVIEERLATKPQPTVEHNRAARVLSLVPGALNSGESLLVMAQNEPLKNPGKWWLLEPMVALQYRTGRYEDALQTIDELRPQAGFSGQRAATEIWAAMTYHQLGRAEDARQSLAAAREFIAGGLPPPGSANGGGDAIVVSLVVIEEAAALIEGGVKHATP